MPMLPGYEDIRRTVQRAFDEEAVVMRRLDVLLTDPEWQLWLLRMLPSAWFGLVDLTDHNPFVMYELGLAHACRIPTILVVNARNAKVTATVAGSPFLTYSDANFDGFREALRGCIRSAVDVIHRQGSQRLSFAQVGHSTCHRIAEDLRKRYESESGSVVEAVAYEEFVTRLDVADGRGELCPGLGHPREFEAGLLPRILGKADDVRVMTTINGWLRSLPRGVAAVA